MPSFLSKVIGRKKTSDKESSPRRKSPSLLEGQAFEAVSPTASPSATLFPSQENLRGREAIKVGKLLGRSKSKSRARSSPPDETSVPHLSLNLAPVRDRKGLDVLFEVDPDAYVVLSDVAIGRKRLTPEETLALVRACSRIISERGLETLGIMHAHWHSASLDMQRKLISLYIVSIDPSPSSSAAAAFESELTYTRSPHDVAAVLRWGLRHLLLSGDSFGASSDWYSAFANAERSQSYPPRAFSESLVQCLPESHRTLLTETLDLFSSLAAHSEANGFSGGRLAKFLGLWLLTQDRSADEDDWGSFYSRWEKMGRMLEHLFLAKIRDEAAQRPMPRRLTELVEQYPFAKNASASDGDLLPRPRLSTRVYDALYVRVDTEYSGVAKPVPHPFNTIASALSADVVPPKPDDGASGIEVSDGVESLLKVWDALKAAALGDNEDGLPVLSNIFSDASVRLLSLLPASEKATTFALTPFDSPRTPKPNGANSEISSAIASWQAQLSSSTTMTTVAPSSSAPSPPDWQAFTSHGFGASAGSRLAATLWDKDVEKTVPPEPASALSRISSRRRSTDRPQHLSFDVPTSPASASVSALAGSVPATPVPTKPSSKVARVARVKLDEAFIDFWTDALLDPISATWPKFVVCELKLPPGTEAHVNFVVIEQAFVRPPPPSRAETPQQQAPPEPIKRSTSPRLSLAPEGRFSFSKRLPFFGDSKGDREDKAGKKNKRAAKTAKAGEMGEIVDQEEPHGSKAALAAGVGVAAAAAAGTTAIAKSEASKEFALAESGPAAGSAESAFEPVPELEATVTPKNDEPATETKDAEPTTELEPVAEQSVTESEPEPTPIEVPVDPSGDALPPAPEHIVLEGSTPGPALALATSEPAAAAQAGAAEGIESVAIEVVPTPAAEMPEPVKATALEPADEPFVPEVEPVAEAAASDASTDAAPAGVSPVEAPPGTEVAATVEEPTARTEEPASVEEPAYAEEPTPVVEPVLNAAPIVAEERPVLTVPVAAPESIEEHVPIEQSAAGEVPVTSEKPVVAEEPAATEEPALAEESAHVGEPTALIKESTVVPVQVEEPIPVENPAVVEEPTTIEESAPVEEPGVVEEPASAKELAAVEEPTVVEPATIEEAPVAESAPMEEAVAVEESLVVEESAPGNEPAAVTESIAADESAVVADGSAAQEVPAEPASAETAASAESTPAHESPAAEELLTEEEPTPPSVDQLAAEPAVEDTAVFAEPPVEHHIPVVDTEAVDDGVGEVSTGDVAQEPEQSIPVAVEDPAVAEEPKAVDAPEPPTANPVSEIVAPDGTTIAMADAEPGVNGHPNDGAYPAEADTP